MFPETFTLLQHEGFLMQGCFKSSLSGLLAIRNAQPGPIYAAFFNYAVGLERLLKILLLLDKWHRERTFLTDAELRAKRHGVENLYNDARALFTQYGLTWDLAYGPDQINIDLLRFVAGFANGNRYYNLDALVGASHKQAENPIYSWQRLFYQAYAADHPKAEPITTKPDMPEDSMSLSELSRHHVIIAAAAPHICCRMTHLLVPMQQLLFAVSEQVRQDDFNRGGPDADPSIPPALDEFLDFITADKSIILSGGDWPYVE